MLPLTDGKKVIRETSQFTTSDLFKQPLKPCTNDMLFTTLLRCQWLECDLLTHACLCAGLTAFHCSAAAWLLLDACMLQRHGVNAL